MGNGDSMEGRLDDLPWSPCFSDICIFDGGGFLSYKESETVCRQNVFVRAFVGASLQFDDERQPDLSVSPECTVVLSFVSWTDALKRKGKANREVVGSITYSSGNGSAWRCCGHAFHDGLHALWCFDGTDLLLLPRTEVVALHRTDFVSYLYQSGNRRPFLRNRPVWQYLFLSAAVLCAACPDPYLAV